MRTRRESAVLLAVGGALAASLVGPASAASPAAPPPPAPASVAEPAPVAGRINLTGPHEVYRSLDQELQVAPGSVLRFQPPPGVVLQQPRLEGWGLPGPVPLVREPSGVLRATVSGWTPGETVVQVTGRVGLTSARYALATEVVATTPAAPVVDLAGPGATQTTLRATAPGVVQQRGGEVLLAPPSGYDLTGSTTQAVVGESGASSGNGFQAGVDANGSLVARLPVTFHHRPSPLAGDVEVVLVTDLSDPPRTETRLHTALDTRPAAGDVPAVVAVVGTNRALYVRSDGSGSYRNLGGVLAGTPAVVRLADGRDLYVAQTPAGELVARSDVDGWRRITAAGARCYDPAAAADGRQLVLACRGADRSLMTARVDVPIGGMPPVVDLVDRGGSLGAGPGVVLDQWDGAATFLVVGTARHASGNVWEQRESGLGGFLRRSLTCTGPPSAAWKPGVQLHVVACRGPAGQAQVSTAFPAYPGGPGAAWTDSVTSFGGQMVGRPALTPSWSGGHHKLTVVGTNGGVYEAVSCCQAIRWTRLPGAASPSGPHSAGVVGHEQFPCSPSVCPTGLR